MTESAPINKPAFPSFRYTGILIGTFIVLLWMAALMRNFLVEVNLTHWSSYVWILIQMQLFTGLFITAHDAMHGTVAPRYPRFNHLFGKICASLFLFNSYKILLPKHHAHHQHVATEADPDFHKGHAGFWLWYVGFLREYISWKQMLLAAITYNVLNRVLGIPEINLVLYWVIPSILSTLQLFYFGTYIPHKGMHDNVHHSGSQSKNHIWAFLSCYFFGYHYEHHDAPWTPWWKLWRLKEA